MSRFRLRFNFRNLESRPRSSRIPSLLNRSTPTLIRLLLLNWSVFRDLRVPLKHPKKSHDDLQTALLGKGR